MLRHARIRYEWQRHELEVNVSDALDADAIAEVTGTFEQTYESRYGSAALLPEARLELVSIRVEAVAPTGAHAVGRTAAATTDQLRKDRPDDCLRARPGTAADGGLQRRRDRRRATGRRAGRDRPADHRDRDPACTPASSDPTSATSS